MKKAVIYGRVSTVDKQDYERQVDDLTRYSKKNDYKIVEAFTEKISGKSKKRPEFDRMLEYLNNNTDVKHILVTELSRFGRLGTKTKVAIEDLAEKGVNIYFQDRGLHSLQENGKVNSDTMMIIGILCDIAKKEVETLQQRIVSGLRFSASKNGALSGKYQAYGFKAINKMMAVDKSEMKIVEEIFRLYKSGLGCSQIANHLNGNGIQTRYNKVVGENNTRTKNGYAKKGIDFSWSSGTIATLLKNKLYKGERWHKEELVYSFEPPIDPRIFDQVQIIMKNRNNRPIRMKNNNNYVKGIIKCGVCGQPYNIHQRKDGKDKAYQCMSKKLEYDGKMDYCGSPSIGIPKLLDSLYYVACNTFIAKLKSSKSSHLAETEAKINIKQIEIVNLKKELEKNERMFSKVVKNLLEEEDDRTIKEYKKQKTDIALSIDKNNQRLKELLSELIDLENHKKKPIRDHYSYEVFLREIRNVITKVIIGKVESKNAKSVDRIFSKKDVAVKVTVKPFDNKDINYVVSRYSKKIYLIGEGNKGNLATTIKPEPFKGAYEIGSIFNSVLDKMIREKIKKAA